jgi:hypothetical protein
MLYEYLASSRTVEEEVDQPEWDIETFKKRMATVVIISNYLHPRREPRQMISSLDFPTSAVRLLG